MMDKNPQRFWHFSSAYNLLDRQPDCEECLALTLTLTINGQQYQIPGANVKVCELSAFRYGFNGKLEFYLPNDQRPDALLSAFVGAELISIDLSIKPVLNLPSPAPQAFQVKALVSEKALHEQAYRELKGAPVLYRYYRMVFCDPAQFIWQQHYPSELYVDTTMASVIKAQVFSPITLDIDFPPADTTLPLVCLALGNADHISSQQTGQHNQASFYDFLLTYVSDNNGYFTYDYTKHSYQISAEEPSLKQSKAYFPHDIARIQHYWPPIKRSVTHLLNATADNQQNIAVPEDLAIDGLKYDLIMRHTLDAQFEQHKGRLTTRIQTNGPFLHVHFTQWPLHNCWPECEIQLEPEVDGQDFLHSNRSYRCHSLFVSLVALEPQPEQDIDLEFTRYQLNYHAGAHPTDKPQPHIPQPMMCCYPLYAEGIVVSEQGEAPEKTYDVPANQDNGQFEYKIHIPLWDQIIKVVLEPDYLNSHFYFPFYRNTKLLIAFDLYRAHIVKVLSWGDGVALPMATQGNHILFGKTNTDQTSLSHIYQDGKPVLAIKRNKQNDTELLQMEEGSIVLQTWEQN